MRQRTHDTSSRDLQRRVGLPPERSHNDRNDPNDRNDRAAADADAPDLSVVHCDARENCSLTHLLVRGWHLVVVRGEATADYGAMLRDVLNTILATGGTLIIVDLARTSTVTPEYIRRLAPVDVELRARGGDLRLVVDGVGALHAIREAGLSGRFEIHRYVGDIVGAVAGLDEGGRGHRRAFNPVPNAG